MKVVFMTVLLLLATHVSAQTAGIAGTYEFSAVMSSPMSGASKQSTQRMVITTRGDSAFATISYLVAGNRLQPDTLRGTYRGNAVSLSSPQRNTRIRMGSETLDVATIDRYEITINGDEITGEISPQAIDDNRIQMFGSSFKGKRVVPGADPAH